MTRLRNPLLLAGLPFLMLGACEPKSPLMTEGTEAVAAQIASTAGCEAWSVRAWNSYTTEASAFGPTCANAVATLVVRAPDGSPVLAWSSPTMHVFGLADAVDSAAMTSALGEWIDQGNPMFSTAADLPEWADGDPEPGEEFPFYPESWIDRPTYIAMRAEKAPIFSFPQGMESVIVYLLRDGQFETIGVQTFPG